jgi:hypothetical protein
MALFYFPQSQKQNMRLRLFLSVSGVMNIVSTAETDSIGQIYFLETDSRPVGKEMPRLLL